MNRDGVKTKQTNQIKTLISFGFGMPRMDSLSGPRDGQTDRQNEKDIRSYISLLKSVGGEDPCLLFCLSDVTEPSQ